MGRLNLSWLPKAVTAAIALFAVLLAMAWLSGLFRRDVIEPHKLPQTQVPPLASMQVTSIKRLQTVDLVGTVQSESRSQVAARIQANIVEMKVDAGSQVKEGDLVATLDDRDLKARLEQAREQLRAAETRRDRAKRRADRLAPLVKDRAASADELDDWTALYTAALAEVSQFQQQIREAEVALSDAHIHSPITGVVVERLADPGDMTTPGKALLVVYDPHNLRLEAMAREAYVGRLDAIRKDGKPLPVLIDSAGREIAGDVTQIVPTADPHSRSFLVKVHLSQPAGLYPGMFGRLRVPLDEAEVVEIPQSAIRQVGQVPMVTVALPGRTQTRALRLGQVRGDKVEVLAGLNAGEQLVVGPQPQKQDH